MKETQIKFIPVPVKGVEVSKEEAEIIAKDFRKALPFIVNAKEDYICHAIRYSCGSYVSIEFIQKLLGVDDILTNWVGCYFGEIEQKMEDSYWGVVDGYKSRELRIAFLKYHIEKFEKYAKE